MATKLTRYILFALLLGIIAGWVINAAIDDGSAGSAEQLKSIAEYLGIITAVFLRLIKMIIAPLVFSTLVVGIAHMAPIAGTASSFQGVISTIGGATIGLVIGQSFDGTQLPFLLGMASCGTVGLLIVLWTERGRLFAGIDRPDEEERAEATPPPEL